MYTFLLTLTKTEAILELEKGKDIVAARKWQESRDMGRQLFEALRDLLTEAKLKPTDIVDFKLETDVTDNFTSVKIAQTVREIFLFAVREGQKK